MEADLGENTFGIQKTAHLVEPPFSKWEVVGSNRTEAFLHGLTRDTVICSVW